MKVNTKIRYGLRAMLEFGLNEDKRNFTGLYQKDIAENQNLSEKYLDPIIGALKILRINQKFRREEKWLHIITTKRRNICL